MCFKLAKISKISFVISLRIFTQIMFTQINNFSPNLVFDGERYLMHSIASSPRKEKSLWMR